MKFEQRHYHDRQDLYNEMWIVRVADGILKRTFSVASRTGGRGQKRLYRMHRVPDHSIERSVECGRAKLTNRRWARG